jgi:hypothetical protein
MMSYFLAVVVDVSAACNDYLLIDSRRLPIFDIESYHLRFYIYLLTKNSTF